MMLNLLVSQKINQLLNNAIKSYTYMKPIVMFIEDFFTLVATVARLKLG
jgi:hypothetical protein